MTKKKSVSNPFDATATSTVTVGGGIYSVVAVTETPRLERKFLDLKEYVHALHHSLHEFRAELRPHMPESEYEDNKGEEGAVEDPADLPENGSAYSPTELRVHRLTNEVRRATSIIEYLRSKIVV